MLFAVWLLQAEDMLLIKPDAAEQVLETRVAAHGIEEGVYFEPLQDGRLLLCRPRRARRMRDRNRGAPGKE